MTKKRNSSLNILITIKTNKYFRFKFKKGCRYERYFKLISQRQKILTRTRKRQKLSTVSRGYNQPGSQHFGVDMNINYIDIGICGVSANETTIYKSKPL